MSLESVIYSEPGAMTFDGEFWKSYGELSKEYQLTIEVKELTDRLIAAEQEIELLKNPEHGPGTY